MVSHVKRGLKGNSKKGGYTRAKGIVVVSSMQCDAQSPSQREMALRKERLSSLQKRIAHRRLQQQQSQSPPQLPPPPQVLPVYQHAPSYLASRMAIVFHTLPPRILRHLASVVKMMQSMDRGAVFGAIDPYMHVRTLCTMTSDEFLREIAVSCLSAGMCAEIRCLHDIIIGGTCAITHDVAMCLTSADFSSAPSFELGACMTCTCKCNDTHTDEILVWMSLPLETRQLTAMPCNTCNCCAYHASKRNERGCEE